jgi:hypothetical protein
MKINIESLNKIEKTKLVDKDQDLLVIIYLKF